MVNVVTKKLLNTKTLNIVMQLSLTVPKLKTQIIFFLVLFHKIFAVTSAYFRPIGIKLLKYFSM